MNSAQLAFTSFTSGSPSGAPSLLELLLAFPTRGLGRCCFLAFSKAASFSLVISEAFLGGHQCFCRLSASGSGMISTSPERRKITDLGDIDTALHSQRIARCAKLNADNVSEVESAAGEAQQRVVRSSLTEPSNTLVISSPVGTCFFFAANAATTLPRANNR